jgi:hypothetical protein
VRAIHTSRNAIIVTLAILGPTSAAVRTAAGTLDSARWPRCPASGDARARLHSRLVLAPRRAFGEKYEELEKARDPFVTEDRTGFVWVLYGK